jgi:hypothetical protein
MDRLGGGRGIQAGSRMGTKNVDGNAYNAFPFYITLAGINSGFFSLKQTFFF